MKILIAINQYDTIKKTTKVETVIISAFILCWIKTRKNDSKLITRTYVSMKILTVI